MNVVIAIWRLTPVHRWLLTDAFPPEPDRPWFLHRTARAHANDFAMAVGSPRGLNHKKWRRGKRGETSNEPVFRANAGRKVRQVPRLHDCARRRPDGLFIGTILLPSMPVSMPLPKCALRLTAFEIYAVTVLSFLDSLAQPDKSTIEEENTTLQWFTAGQWLRGEFGWSVTLVQ